MRYVIILHHYWMEHKDWDVRYVEADSKEDAYKEGLVLKERVESTFNCCDIMVIGLDKEDVVAVVSPPTFLSKLMKRLT